MTAHKPPTRIAGTNPRFIDEVDGVPSTHTPPPAEPDRKLHHGLPGTGPHTFTAKQLPATAAVTAMCAVVLTATVTALLAITAGDPNQARTVALCLGGLAAWITALALPALFRRHPVGVVSVTGSGTASRSTTEPHRPTTQNGGRNEQARREATGPGGQPTGGTGSGTRRSCPVEEWLTSARPEQPAGADDRTGTSAPNPVMERRDPEGRGRRRERQREPQAAGAAEGGGETQTLGNGETSSPHERTETTWQ